MGYFPSNCVTLFDDISTEKISNDNNNLKNTKITTKRIKRRKSGLVSDKFSGSNNKGQSPRFYQWNNNHYQRRNPLIKSLINVFTFDSSFSQKVFGVDLETHLRNSERDGKIFY